MQRNAPPPERRIDQHDQQTPHPAEQARRRRQDEADAAEVPLRVFIVTVAIGVMIAYFGPRELGVFVISTAPVGAILASARESARRSWP